MNRFRDKLKEELLLSTSEDKKEEVTKMYEAFKRKKHESELIWFKIMLKIHDLSDLTYNDLPISFTIKSILQKSAPCANLLKFWTLGSSGIQLLLSENGVHEDLPIIMKSVNRMIDLIDQYNGNKI